MTEFEELILRRLESLEGNVDRVRTQDLPQVKLDVALLIQEGKAKSKLHATICSILAFVASTFVAIKFK